VGERAVIVLDTHALIWWVAEPNRIPARARRAVAAALKAREPLTVSAISAWEVAMLADRGRLELTMDADVWLSHVQALPELRFVPVDSAIAVRAVRLAGFPHRDPADRMIAATAMAFGATLVTADTRLRGYEPLTSLWD
jgi:PIN domain nuclease of toxin-antitoxin system